MKQLMNFKCSNQSSTSGAVYSDSTSSARTFVNSNIIEQNGFIEMDVDSEIGKYSIIDIADWFLKKGNMTQKKLQKLCYYAQAWCYALYGYRLINSDFQAWVHGPVSPVLYEKFRHFGFETIRIKGEININLDDEDAKLLEDVWETYGDRTGNALEALTHTEEPWLEARRGYSDNERCTVVISPDSMKRYYRRIYTGESQH